jgi:hypothetical protein
MQRWSVLMQLCGSGRPCTGHIRQLEHVAVVWLWPCAVSVCSYCARLHLVDTCYS